MSETAWSSIARVESDRFHFDVAERPSWVEITENAGVIDSRPGRSIRYLLSEWQTRIGDNDVETEAFTRIKYSPVAYAGLQEAAEISIDFRPTYEDLVIHYVKLSRNGGTLNKLNADQVKLIQHERALDRHQYNGEVTALLVLDDVRVGDVIEYAYTIKGRNPVFAGKYFNSFPLGWKVPVDQVSIRILAPAHRQLNSRIYNAEVNASDFESDGYHVYQWTVNKTGAIRDEDNVPGWFNPYPWLQVTEYSNWEEVSDWAERLYSYKEISSAILKNKIASWRRNNANDLKGVQEAIAFVQDNVRYFGVEMGTNSHMPSQPDLTFDRRFGDCKDKSVLLVAILNEMGLKARPALVSTEYSQAIAQWLPSPGVFDHVIVKVEIDNQYYWVDATRVFQRGPLNLRGQPNYGRALVVGGSDKGLEPIRLATDYLPSVDIEERFVAHDFSGTVDFIVTSRFSFGEAESRRRYFSSHSLDEIQAFYLNFYARYYPGLLPTADIQLSDNESLNVFTVTEYYQIPEYWDHRDGRLYSNFHGSGISDYTRLPSTLNRQLPLSISFPLHVSHSAILEFPEDVGFNQLAINEKIDDPSMKFIVQSSYKDRQLRVDYIYDTLADVVMPEDMAVHLANRRRINDNLFYSAWVGDAESLSNQALMGSRYRMPEQRNNQTSINNSHY